MQQRGWLNWTLKKKRLVCGKYALVFAFDLGHANVVGAQWRLRRADPTNPRVARTLHPGDPLPRAEPRLRLDPCRAPIYIGCVVQRTPPPKRSLSNVSKISRGTLSSVNRLIELIKQVKKSQILL
jgi:hypothetical protein